MGNYSSRTPAKIPMLIGNNDYEASSAPSSRSTASSTRIISGAPSTCKPSLAQPVSAPTYPSPTRSQPGDTDTWASSPTWLFPAKQEPGTQPKSPCSSTRHHPLLQPQQNKSASAITCVVHGQRSLRILKRASRIMDGLFTTPVKTRLFA